MTIKTLAGIALAATLVGGTALANEAPLWRTFQKWEIRVDPNLGQGCFMQASYPQSGTVLRIGFNISDDNPYFEVMNSNWNNSLQVGADVTVMLSFDGSQPKPWTGRVLTVGNTLHAVYFPTKDYRFFDAVAAARGIYISYNGLEVLHGELLGSAQAVYGMAECQQAFLATNTRRAPIDPFRSTAPARPIDPFKGV